MKVPSPDPILIRNETVPITSQSSECVPYKATILSKKKKGNKHEPVKANVPPSTAQRRVIKWRKLRRSSLMVTVIGDKSYKKYTALFH